MKKIFVATAALFGLATTAFAADMPMAAPYTKAPVFAPAVFSWTGCYIGIEGGGNWGQSNQVARTGPAVGASVTGNFNLSGGIVGGTLGCNYQVSSIVLGVENDYSWTNKQGTAQNLAPFTPGFSYLAEDKKSGGRTSATPNQSG